MPSTQHWEEEFERYWDIDYLPTVKTGVKNLISRILISVRTKLLEEIESQEAEGYEAENILESIKNNSRFK